MLTAAGLIFDDSPHYIDHIAPFCALQKWPLILCEGEIADLARRYYPGLEIIERNFWDVILPPLVVSCYPRNFIESIFQSTSSHKFLWLPHGNSDKGWESFSFESLQSETALVYGQKMIDFMHQKKVFLPSIRIGNFRLAYWKQHLSFYDPLVSKVISLQKRKKTYLYAPTWEDAEGNGTFLDMFSLLINHLPDDCNLIIKAHPNTEKKFAPEIEQWVGRHAHRSNVFFLSLFPPIYPLLNLCDVYIGDMSSIGYDFLYWSRPMYFFKKPTESSPFLYRCGTELSLKQVNSLFHCPEADRKAVQAKIYADTFDSYSPESLIHHLKEEGQTPPSSR